ncbi:MAG: hypothetical protein Q7T87_02485 [Polaromonas sp.]|nr:hypothetical protein [Polaromonas sp.]
MQFRTISGALTQALAITALTCGAAHAAKFSDLKVVQEAAQDGTWTMVTSGPLPNGKPMPPRSNTVCATKAEVIKSLSNPFMWNEKTGEEDKTCPTVLTTNTSTLGVATMKCAPISINLPGQKVDLPANQELSTEFKRTGKETWTVKTGQVLTNVTYHGSATAGCVAKR